MEWKSFWLCFEMGEPEPSWRRWGRLSTSVKTSLFGIAEMRSGETGEINSDIHCLTGRIPLLSCLEMDVAALVV